MTYVLKQEVSEEDPTAERVSDISDELELRTEQLGRSSRSPTRRVIHRRDELQSGRLGELEGEGVCG